MGVLILAESKYTAPDRERRRKALRKLLHDAATPQKTEELHRDLEKQFGAYSIRTTRRDLVAMAGRPRLVKPAAKKPSAKSLLWSPGRGSVDLTLSPMECMTLTAIFQHADRFGFRSDTEDLAKLREYASSELLKVTKRDLVAEGRISIRMKAFKRAAGVKEISAICIVFHQSLFHQQLNHFRLPVFTF
jgi:hypothetical protein